MSTASKSKVGSFYEFSMDLRLYPGDRMCGIENPRGSENNEVLAREIECLAVRGGR